MAETRYYGEFKASTLSQTGCVHKFITKVSSNILFPPQVNYFCRLCNAEHGFGLVKTWVLYSDKQVVKFTEYCLANEIETEVPIT